MRVVDRVNSLPTTASSLKKQNNMYKVLTPNILMASGLIWLLQGAMG